MAYDDSIFYLKGKEMDSSDFIFLMLKINPSGINF